MTPQALKYQRQQNVINNLAQDIHYYDDLVASLISCKVCNGSGEVIKKHDIGDWETEGGAITKPIICECRGEKSRITEDMVRRFFELPMPSRDIKLVVRRSGAVGFDVSIYVSLNPALQDNAMRELDLLLFNERNLTWLISINNWKSDHLIGVAYRHFSGTVKEGQELVQRWLKIVQQKVGQKNVTVECHMQN